MINFLKWTLYGIWCLFDLLIAAIFVIPIIFIYRNILLITGKNKDEYDTFPAPQMKYVFDIKALVKNANKKFKNDFKSIKKNKGSKEVLQNHLVEICIHLLNSSHRNNEKIEKTRSDWEEEAFKLCNSEFHKRLEVIYNAVDDQDRFEKLKEFFIEIDNYDAYKTFMNNRPGYSHIFKEAPANFRIIREFFNEKNSLIDKNFN